jgi:hypothetical protein
MTPITSNEPLYPMRAYLYDHDGTHGEPIVIKDQEELYGPELTDLICAAFALGRKIIITDPGDFCLFHAEGCKILFPPELVPDGKSTVVLVIEV